MISKELFCKVINTIKERWDFEDELNELLRKGLPDSTVMLSAGYEDVLVDLLATVVSTDTYKAIEDITYFMYELNFGAGWEPGAVTKDGKDIPLGTIDDLWECILDGRAHS